MARFVRIGDTTLPVASIESIHVTPSRAQLFESGGKVHAYRAAGGTQDEQALFRAVCAIADRLVAAKSFVRVAEMCINVAFIRSIQVTPTAAHLVDGDGDVYVFFASQEEALYGAVKAIADQLCAAA